ncbi:MAG: hypothetical protein GX558_07365 [Clostridiales bacterium]|nr:hypothetical protein [Clostridiales bacterium]
MAKKKKPDAAPPEQDIGVVALGTEVTGLMPAKPEGTAQAESYQELYPVHKPQTRDKT